MLKIILQSRNLRHLPIVTSSCAFHLTSSSVGSQDYDLSDDVTLLSTARKSKRSSENKSTENLGAVSPKLIKTKLKFFLDCTDEEIEGLLKENKSFLKLSLSRLTKMLEFLFDRKISTRAILENPWLLEMRPSIIDEKLKLLAQLEPCKDINDYVPLVRNSSQQIAKIKRIFAKEKNDVPGGNRIQYFAAKVGVEPMTVSRYFSTRMFMLEIGLDQLYENLDIMLEYEVSAQSILTDLWGFRYLPKTIRSRLERSKKGSKEVLKPWMIRCTEEILQRSIEISKDSTDLLNGKTIVEYLAERLGYDTDTVMMTMMKQEQMFKLRPRRAKEILDYLMDEEGFQPYQILSVIRILCHSLETTKKRIDELKALGCRPSSLVILCRSQNEYQKFLNAWQHKRSQLEQMSNQINQ